MKRHITTLLLCAVAICGAAQRIQKSFSQMPLSDVLIAIDRASDKYTVNFIYDELEDFSVTAAVDTRDAVEAVRQVVGFYPMRISTQGNDIFVECTQKEETKLTGRVVDEAGRGVEFASVALLNTADSTLLTGGVTNADGLFVIPCAAREVIARVTFVGYRTAWRRMRVERTEDIVIRPETTTISGVTVKGRRPAFTMGREGMITNVEGTSLSTAGTASDVLALLPNVDGSGTNFRVFGRSGSPEIYINGRRMRNGNELTQLKSDEIRHVEVITNPGARYSAETTSVIKITTLRRAGEGLSGTFEAQYRQSERTSLYEDTKLNWRKGGLDLSTDIFLNSKSYVQHQTTTQSVYGGKITSADRMDIDYKSKDIYADLKANYEFDENNSAGVQYSINTPSPEVSFADNGYASENGNVTNSLQYDTHVNYDDHVTHSMNAYYLGQLGRMGIDFNFDYINSRQRTIQNTAVTENGSSAETVLADNRSRSRMYASKLVLTYPLWQGELSAGCEYTSTRRDNAFDSEGGVPSHTDDRIEESTIAGFADYGVRLGRWMAQAGVRYESTVSDYYERGIRVDEQSRDYAKWFPTAGIAYSADGLQLRLGYSMKTQRPQYNQLTSNVQYSNRYTYEGGNPLLRPAMTHSIDMQATWQFVSLYAGYTTTTDYILWTDLPYGDKAVRTTFENIDRMSNLNLMLSASLQIGPWEPRYSVGFSKQFIDGADLGVVGRFEKPVWSLKLNNSLHLPLNLILGVNYRYTGRGSDDLCLSEGGSSLGLSLYRAFLKDRLAVRLNANDLLKKDYDRSTYQGRHLTFRRDNYSDSRSLVLTVRYSFNATKSKYKGTGAGNEEKSRL